MVIIIYIIYQLYHSVIILSILKIFIQYLTLLVVSLLWSNS